jgi:N6-adenosine-specific RNA methylase IME4
MGKTIVLAAPSKNRQIAKVHAIITALDKATKPEEVRNIQVTLDAAEQAMEAVGLFSVEERRPVNEARIRARAKLGRLLEKMEKMNKAGGPGRGKKTSRTEKPFTDLLKRIGLDKSRASEVQRISAIPDPVLAKRFHERASKGELTFISQALEWSRPFWKIKHRRIKHRKIKAAANAVVADDIGGPFPLVYADPPWRFQTYSESGGGKSPDQHYPTLSDEEILSFKIAGKPVSEIAHKDAVLFLWCTSSNLPLALKVMDRWGFDFRTCAVWVKPGIGTGLIFRNRHELLLYGTRGAMPGPATIPPSVFEYPKGAHSEKPSEIRAIIEQMFPDFDASHRLELFHRGEAPPGWVTYGYETKPV